MVDNQLNSFHIQDTTATSKIFALKKRIRAVSGGTSASKTVSILVWLIDYCQTGQDREKLCTVVSESFPHLEGGSILDFETIMKDRGYWKDSRWNKTKHTYVFETGNKLQFTSMDKYGKAHGPRRDVLFVNEANNLQHNIVDQLITRTREVVWLDWNPTNEFWFYTEMLGKRDDIDFITLTYLDNEALDLNTKQEIESHRGNKSWWTVYGEGKLGEVEGRIYTGWNIIQEIPFEARLEKYGLDFGYSIDPTVIIAVYYYNGSYILDEITYQKGLSNKTIADILNSQTRALVIADSAEPKSIDELISYGINVVGAVKGQGSVMQGIQYVQGQKISVTERSVRTIKAYRNYMMRKDLNGRFINEPDDTIHEWSNPMDAIRYAIASTQKQAVWKPKDPGGVKPYISGTLI